MVHIRHIKALSLWSIFTIIVCIFVSSIYFWFFFREIGHNLPFKFIHLPQSTVFSLYGCLFFLAYRCLIFSTCFRHLYWTILVYSVTNIQAFDSKDCQLCHLQYRKSFNLKSKVTITCNLIEKNIFSPFNFPRVGMGKYR